MPHILNKENIERLAILISCGHEKQLIGVTQIENSKGHTQANAVFSEVIKWGAVEKNSSSVF